MARDISATRANPTNPVTYARIHLGGWTVPGREVRLRKHASAARMRVCTYLVDRVLALGVFLEVLIHAR